ncbi:hypothetical protein [Nonomuraea typhae]|uniref:hypothetical protein n=1 Tax=Nonomuraea typhae TaxID=2603600 RepID=UPI0012FAECC8|nr:hypothetical protein [Nonomuraea typhae]
MNQPDTETMVDIANAARLLYNAETITDLALMERLERLADSWVSPSSSTTAKAPSVRWAWWQEEGHYRSC